MMYQHILRLRLVILKIIQDVVPQCIALAQTSSDGLR